MSSRLALACAGAALVLAAAPASGALIVLSNTTATWWNPTGNTATVTYANNATPSATVSWGTPVPSNGPKSAYRFAVASNNITTNVPPTTPFTVGTFTHFNNPIAAGTDITGVSLRLTTNLTIDGSNLGTKTFDYAFHHDETPNQAPCTYGAPGDTPCPDAVTVTSMPSSQTFIINGVAYTLSFSDFVQNGVPTGQFISQENQTNMADIRAMVTAAAVPEPAGWAMLATGFGLVGRGMRQRRKLRPPSAV